MTGSHTDIIDTSHSSCHTECLSPRSVFGYFFIVTLSEGRLPPETETLVWLYGPGDLVVWFERRLFYPEAGVWMAKFNGVEKAGSRIDT